MILIFIILCICVYACTGDCTVYGVTTYDIGNACIYQCFHGSWVHLFVNSLSLILIFKPIKDIFEVKIGEINQFGFFAIAYIGSIFAALFTAQDVPTVGASGIVFFLLGELIMLRPTLKQLQSFIYIAIALVVQFIRGKSNVALHIVAFVLGALFIIICLLRRKYNERLEGIND